MGIMLIRAFTIFSFRPLFALFNNPVSVANATIATWGGLRGAVSLALALMLSQTAALPEAFRQQVLLLTAVIVMMTVVFNGTTMKYLLRWLRLDKPSLAAQITENLAHLTVLKRVRRLVDDLAASDDFRHVYWADVRDEVNGAYEKRQDTIALLEAKTCAGAVVEHEAEFWLKVVNVERSAYWSLFSKGLLSREAIALLNHELDLQIDALKHGKIAPPSQRAPEPSVWSQSLQALVQRFNVMQRQCGFIIFNRLILSFHFYHAESYAAKRVLEELHALKGMDPDFETRIRTTYTNYLNNAKQRLEEMRVWFAGVNPRA